jgi:hypothetical protein
MTTAQNCFTPLKGMSSVYPPHALAKPCSSKHLACLALIVLHRFKSIYATHLTEKAFDHGNTEV